MPITLIDHLRNLPQYLLPQRTITRCAYRLTRIRTPWFKNALIRGFIRHFGVDMNEAQNADYRVYETFNAFFTRPLRPEARPIVSGERSLCCPVDGTVSQAGRIDDDKLFQAKGHSYTLTQLLGDEPARAELFRHGEFTTLYLSPRDYHRIHMPLAGRLREMVYIPGRLFSVSPLTTRVVPALFARNERLLTLFDTSAGPMALILVGAINVASLETVWAGPITPPRLATIQSWNYGDPIDSIKLTKGDEMGRFNMGSTVIVLFAKNTVQWDPAIQANEKIRMGQCLATLR